jgi:bifunctional DNA-binding transcriptional regulator/antitoxin component of YhaV-PrlF toxin-antitoxin module
MKFDAVIDVGGGGVSIPFDVREIFGAARVPVRARVNGVEYRTTIVRMGGEWVIPVRREIRERAGVEIGDSVTVELERDDAPREVEVPPELAELLDDDLREFFDSLSYTHQREYVEWITSAKREETRQRRLAKAVEMLRERIKTPG